MVFHFVATVEMLLGMVVHWLCVHVHVQFSGVCTQGWNCWVAWSVSNLLGDVLNCSPEWLHQLTLALDLCKSSRELFSNQIHISWLSAFSYEGFKLLMVSCSGDKLAFPPTSSFLPHPVLYHCSVERSAFYTCVAFPVKTYFFELP